MHTNIRFASGDYYVLCYCHNINYKNSFIYLFISIYKFVSTKNSYAHKYKICTR